MRVPLRVNALGLRGPAPTDTRPRWLTLGDSFTLGMQVPEAQTFQALLGDALDAQVLNGGVDGYSTFNALGLYDEVAPVLDVDGVLLVFFVGNDFADNARFMPNTPGRWADPDAVSEGPHLSPGRLFLLRHSRVAALLTLRSRGAAYADPSHRVHQQWRDELTVFTTDGAATLTKQSRATDNALRLLLGAAAKRGDPVVVALAPPAFAVDPDRLAATFELVGLDPKSADVDAPAREMARLLEITHTPTCDLTPALRASVQAGDDPYLRYDGHWSEAGHQVVAQALSACMSGL